MDWSRIKDWFLWVFDSRRGMRKHLLPRWLFLRALGLIYFSAFLPLLFQIRGLMGPAGILPVGALLEGATRTLGGPACYWQVPSVFWFSTSNAALTAVCWIGLIASLLVVLNLWPRASLFICFICFLSFVTAAREFSGYQSDSMLLEAGFIALFFAPPGLRPGWGESRPASRISYFLLLWEWFRIYFESGVVKIASGDPTWRNFTAMDEYYQNGPLPTWIGWYVQHLPHWFHAATVFTTLALELVIVWAMFFPRRVRIVLFWIVTPWQIGVILTANYTFLNYPHLFLGILLLDDRFIGFCTPRRWKKYLPAAADSVPPPSQDEAPSTSTWALIRHPFSQLALSISAFLLAWDFYSTTALLVFLLWPSAPLPTGPIEALEPSRIAGRYGLFAVMTPHRYEIEFQGSNDGTHWIPYPFRFKPQDVTKAPGIYAPYQPRFEWNLWFASLGAWNEFPMIPNTEIRLLQGSKDVLSLFARNPFPDHPPQEVRAVIYQYWFSTMQEKRTEGIWWTRKLLGLYAPAVELEPDGKVGVVQWPTGAPPPEQ
jgi:lipase maturation factor 1